MKFAYFNAYNGNFGDQLNLPIIKKLYPEAMFIDLCGIDRKLIVNRKERFVFSLGSIFHYAQPGDVVWGTGINPHWQNGVPDGIVIKAVRGPLTREYLIDHGIPCPEVYGDPAMLLPDLFPAWKASPVSGKITVIPHFHDVNHPELNGSYLAKLFSGLTAGFSRGFSTGLNVVNCSLAYEQVIAEIVESELVISSSLHGIIVAEAFGVPARWWNSRDSRRTITEGTFKYNDYFLSTNRPMNQYGNTIVECIEMGGETSVPKFDDSKLLHAFPREHLKGTTSKI